MYNYGTAARAPEYTPDAEEKKAEELRRKRLIARRDRLIKIRAIRTLVIIAAILGIITAREAQITQLCGQISNLEDEEENLTAVVTEKEMHLTEALDLNAVEETAIYKLGMKKPDQFVEVSFDGREGGEVLKNQDKPKGVFATILSQVKVFLEYLY